MEKIESICKLRDLAAMVARLEARLQSSCEVTLNEAMAICCISRDRLTASQISEATGLAPSHTSKVLRTIELKGLVARTLGETDKRQMLFALTPLGIERLELLKNTPLE